MSEQNTQVRKDDRGDWLLRAWISGTGKGGEGFSVVLTTAAGIISGTLISEARYLDSIGTAMADGWGEQAEAFRNLFAPMREFEGQLPIHYVHLKDAQLVTLQGAMPVGVNGLWRGDLNAIIGHSIGRITLSQVSG
ncbi:hypothetical protein [Pseudomonas fluorescens]|uniref:hypothetical protein n=1 Tax=Pseudomonas fluorescens TaxID=294 RepID=UPI0007321FE6|nr:hypothetical protein [Pseudomonas fluorescens]